MRIVIETRERLRKPKLTEVLAIWHKKRPRHFDDNSDKDDKDDKDDKSDKDDTE